MPLIYDLSKEDINRIVSSWGEPRYRTDQIWQGLYRQLWNQPEQFTTLPAALRHKMEDAFDFSHLEPQAVQFSSDGETRKSLFHLPDQQAVEAVLMTYHRRRTVCISTQAGCAMGCVFCATGQMGFRRNLSAGEIVEQVLVYARELSEAGDQLTNIVIMGMGEPFHNYEQTMQAINRLNDPEGFNFGQRRITVSTVGLVPMILRFARENQQVNLAVSLHAADDELRSSMLPINRKYPLSVLIPTCREYVQITHRRITFEWALIRDVNDTPEQARKLVKLIRGLHCHVNVIPLNPTTGFTGEATTHANAVAFQTILQEAGIPCTIRVRRGIDIQAGCGQLAIKNEPAD